MDKKITDELKENPALEEKLAELEIFRQSFEEKKKEAEKYYDQLLRLKADFENYRKRIDKEKMIEFIKGKKSVITNLVGILDSIECAETLLDFPAEKENLESICKGLNLITKEFRNLLKQEGIKEIETVGKKFDPLMHEVFEQEVIEDGEDGIITSELKKGYILDECVIRPAMVKVAKKKVDGG